MKEVKKLFVQLNEPATKNDYDAWAQPLNGKYLFRTWFKNSGWEVPFTYDNISEVIDMLEREVEHFPFNVFSDFQYKIETVKGEHWL